MIERDTAGLFRVEIPLPNSPLKFLNSLCGPLLRQESPYRYRTEPKECLDAIATLGLAAT